MSSTIKADQIIVLNDGKIVERGDHKELMKMDGLYKKMFETQKNSYI
ncbi:MAG: hypothetical protein Q4B52_03375 [Tissierellia bacterium]|nr:hypothetical protein [Tissierellia bacterium]